MLEGRDASGFGVPVSRGGVEWSPRHVSARGQVQFRPGVQSVTASCVCTTAEPAFVPVFLVSRVEGYEVA